MYAANNESGFISSTTIQLNRNYFLMPVNPLFLIDFNPCKQLFCIQLKNSATKKLDLRYGSLETTFNDNQLRLLKYDNKLQKMIHSIPVPLLGGPAQRIILDPHYQFVIFTKYNVLYRYDIATQTRNRLDQRSYIDINNKCSQILVKNLQTKNFELIYPRTFSVLQSFEHPEFQQASMHPDGKIIIACNNQIFIYDQKNCNNITVSATIKQMAYAGNNFLALALQTSKYKIITGILNLSDNSFRPISEPNIISSIRVNQDGTRAIFKTTHDDLMIYNLLINRSIKQYDGNELKKNLIGQYDKFITIDISSLESESFEEFYEKRIRNNSNC